MTPLAAIALRRERRIKQARAFRRACILSVLITMAAVTVLGIAQSLDLIHLHEFTTLAETANP